MGDEDIAIYTLDDDIQAAARQEVPQPEEDGADWLPFFHPKSFVKDHPDYTMDSKRLEQQ